MPSDIKELRKKVRERQFSLIPSHLKFTHDLWRNHCKIGDIAIDCTCGNGYDTLAIAEMILSENQGQLYAIDIQQAALEKTQQHLEKHLQPKILNRIELLQNCHADLPQIEDVSLIIYNFGYLPGSDKKLTTNRRSSLKSVQKALTLLKPGGLLSMTCYPGHDEGAEEEKLLLEFCQSLPVQEWCVTHHRWLNRHLAPSVILIEKTVV